MASELKERFTLRAALAAPGGTFDCPRCDQPVFHLYDDEGALRGVTCTSCDYHRYASARMLASLPTLDEASDGEERAHV